MDLEAPDAGLHAFREDLDAVAHPRDAGDQRPVTTVPKPPIVKTRSMGSRHGPTIGPGRHPVRHPVQQRLQSSMPAR